MLEKPPKFKIMQKNTCSSKTFNSNFQKYQNISIYTVNFTVMPLAGRQGKPTWNFGVQLTLLQPGGQIVPTTLLLAHPDLKT